MNTQETIQGIKNVINLYGSFGVADVEANSSPVVNSLGSSALLAENFNELGAEVNLYNGDDLVSVDFIGYEKLPTDTLEEIYHLAQDWEATCIQTRSRCED